MRRRNVTHQNGTVVLDKRTNNWYYRWRDKATGTRPAKLIGSKRQYPTVARAKKAAELFRAEANREQVTAKPGSEVLFDKVIDAYMVEDLPRRVPTRRAILCNLKNHIRPEWGHKPVASLNPMQVEKWLKGLHHTKKTKDNELVKLDYTKKTKEHLRDLMRQLVNLAMRHGWVQLGKNPVELVRIVEASCRRPKKRKSVHGEVFKGLLAAMSWIMLRTMVILCACLGLRASELVGLKWSDINWVAATVHVQRRVVDGDEDETKTSYSEQLLPLDAAIVQVLKAWREVAPFKEESDWIFASPASSGRLPYQSRGLQQAYLRPVGEAMGFGSIGWHSLRHGYRTMLRRLGTPLEVQRELMRHSTIAMTMKYGETELPELRIANSAVVGQMLN